MNAKIIQPKTNLKDKVAASETEDLSIDPTAITRAEEYFSAQGLDYIAIAEADIEELQKTLQNFKSTADTKYIVDMHRIAHDIKGQAGSFGYLLLTEFAHSLAKFTKLVESPSKEQIEVIKAHVDALTTIINNRIDGDGGEIGQALKSALQLAVAKFASQPL